MSFYNHILFATDLSEESIALAKKALLLAKLMQAKFSIIHVVLDPTAIYATGEYSIPVDENINQELIQEAQKKLSEFANLLQVEKSNCHLLQGSTKNKIIDLVKRIQADAIIVGGHDTSGLKIIFGSTANALVHAMPVDIIVFKV